MYVHMYSGIARLLCPCVVLKEALRDEITADFQTGSGLMRQCEELNRKTFSLVIFRPQVGDMIRRVLV